MDWAPATCGCDALLRELASELSEAAGPRLAPDGRLVWDPHPRLHVGRRQRSAESGGRMWGAPLSCLFLSRPPPPVRLLHGRRMTLPEP